MVIPNFDSNLVLPPHLGNPTQPHQLSPYPCTALELCQRFGTTSERRQLLEGFLKFRTLLSAVGFATGFQWLDGSFLEDVETREDRAPQDLDVVTFYMPPDQKFNQQVAQSYPDIWNLHEIKAKYHLDHYWVDIAYNPMLTVEQTRYWIGLFSHRRDGIWKGMLRIELNTSTEDDTAKNFLRSPP